MIRDVSPCTLDQTHVLPRIAGTIRAPEPRNVADPEGSVDWHDEDKDERDGEGGACDWCASRG